MRCGGRLFLGASALAAALLALLAGRAPAPAPPPWARADLSGRVAIVTGATGVGLGLEHARALLAMNATVVVVGRDEGRVAAALRVLRTAGCNNGACAGEALGGGELLADLSDLRSVRAFAAAFARRFARLDVLALNAGVMKVPLADATRTAQGFEQAVGVNHLAHFLLARLLAPQLSASASLTGDARVVVVSSVGHLWGDLRDAGGAFDEDLAFQRRGRRQLAQAGFEGYTRSKLANVLFAAELARRAAGTGVRAFSLHPGAVATDIFRHVAPEGAGGGALGAALEAVALPLARLFLRTPAEGARTQVFLSAAPLAAIAGASGGYFHDGFLGHGPHFGRDPRQAAWPHVSAQSGDDELAAALWRRSEELTADGGGDAPP